MADCMSIWYNYLCDLEAMQGAILHHDSLAKKQVQWRLKMYYDLTLRITPKMVQDANGNERVSLMGHLGTHFDIMNKEFPLDYLKRPAVFFDVSDVRNREICSDDIDLTQAKKGMFVGFCTGCIREYDYGTRDYYSNPVPLSTDLIERLLSKGICIIGIDGPGIRAGKEHAPMDQHCADHGVFIVENMIGMEALLNNNKYILCYANTYPVSYSDMTGLPCRVIGETGDCSGYFLSFPLPNSI